MNNVRILPYKSASSSARDLSRALGTLRISLRDSSIHNSRPKTIINWGNSGRNLPPAGLGSQHTILNPLDKVAVAGNKLRCLEKLSEAGVTTPEFTDDVDVARGWQGGPLNTHQVVERHTLTGSGGEGIVLKRRNEPLTAAPLYTQYVPKTDEYRIHVMEGTVIDMQRKARNMDVPNDQVNWRVRNHANGFVFVRQNVNPPTQVIHEAVAAVNALELHFGAVDIIWNQHRNAAYVLEVNTACGLEGTTLERYAAAFRAVLRGEAPTSVLPAPSMPVQAELHLATDESEPEQAPEDQTPFVVGCRVTMSEAAPYPEDAYNPRNMEGTVVRYNEGSSLPIGVTWDNGFENPYRDEDLVLVGEPEEQAPEEQAPQISDELFELPDVQSSRQVKYLLAINGLVDVNEGIFDTREAAEQAQNSDVLRNL